MILPDVLAENLRVVFCGTAAGNRSAEVRAYYAGRGNKFWRVIAQVGLTPRILRPAEYVDLLRFGVGLTDLAKESFGCDSDINGSAYDLVAFRRKIEYYSPKAVAFNGKRAASEFFGCHTSGIRYGRQDKIDEISVFVLPSTSGAAGGSWDIAYWHELAGNVAESRSEEEE